MNLPRASQQQLARMAHQAAQALAAVRALGADHAEVRIDHGLSLTATVRDGALEQLSEAQSLGLALRVMVGGRVAAVTTSDLRPEALGLMLARAVELAQLAEEDWLAEPPSPRALARRWPELDVFDASIARLGADRASRLAQLAEAAARTADPRIVASGGAVCSRSINLSLLATSGGFIGPSATTRVGLRAQVIAEDAAGHKRSGHYWSGGRHLQSLDPPEIGRASCRERV